MPMAQSIHVRRQGGSDFIKDLRSSAPKLFAELNSRREIPKTKMSESEFMDFKISFCCNPLKIQTADNHLCH
jgi:hypothetical protein